MDADTLSRFPLDIKKYMELCTNKITTEALDTTVNVVLAQSKGEIAWVSYSSSAATSSESDKE